MPRIPLDNDNWQQAVEGYMRTAKAVIVRAGYTDGILTEMETAVKCVKPERLVFLLPFEPDQGRSNLLQLGQRSPAGYERFRQRLQKYIPRALPVFEPRRWPASSRMAQCSFSGILFFEPDWTPHIVVVDSTKLHVSAKTLLKRSLRPFLASYKKENHLTV